MNNWQVHNKQTDIRCRVLISDTHIGNEIKQPIAIDESAEVIFEIDPEDMPNQSKLKKRRSLQFQSRRKVISKRPAVLTEVCKVIFDITLTFSA